MAASLPPVPARISTIASRFSFASGGNNAVCKSRSNSLTRFSKPGISSSAMAAISTSRELESSRLRWMRRSKSMIAIPKALGIEIVRRNGERAGQLSFFTRAHGLGAAVTLGEFLDATGGVDEFLLAREKRMAGGADTDSNVALSRTGVIHRAARANDVSLVIFWMN